MSSVARLALPVRARPSPINATFAYSDLCVRPAIDDDARRNGSGEDGRPGTGPPGPVTIGTDGAAEIACTVGNTGDVAGAEVVQLYLRDPVAQVTRPVRYLAGFARVTLEPGQSCRVTFRLHADRTAFHGVSGTRVVELRVSSRWDIGTSSADLALHAEIELSGPERRAGTGRVLTTPVTVLYAGTQAEGRTER